MRTRLVLWSLFAAPALAQQPTDAGAFVPADYRCELMIDFAALDKLGLLEPMSRSPMKLLFDVFEGHFGFALSHLARLRLYPPLPDERGPDGRGRRTPVVLFEGDHNVGLPPVGLLGDVKEDKIGGTAVLIEQAEWRGDERDLYLSPREGTLVVGSERLLRPVLEGRGKPGTPPPDFLSLTSGRGNLAYMVMAMTPATLQEMSFVTQEMWSAEDPPKFLLVRLRNIAGADGEDDDVRCEIVVRCTGKQGPEVVAAAARQALAAAVKHPRLGALKPVWQKIELKTDGIDVVAQVSLGRPRDAAGTLGLLLAPLMMVGTTEVQVAAPAAVPVQPAPPAPQPAGGKEAGKEGGKEAGKEGGK